MASFLESKTAELLSTAISTQQEYIYKKQLSLMIYYTLRFLMTCSKFKENKDEKLIEQIEKLKKQYEDAIKETKQAFNKWQEAYIGCFKDKNITSLSIINLDAHINKVVYFKKNIDMISLNITFPDLEEKILPSVNCHLFFKEYSQSCRKIQHFCGLISILEAKQNIANYKKYLVKYIVRNDTNIIAKKSINDEFDKFHNSIKNASLILTKLVFENLNRYHFPNMLSLELSEKTTETINVSLIVDIIDDKVSIDTTEEQTNKRKSEKSSYNKTPYKLQKYDKKNDVVNDDKKLDVINDDKKLDLVNDDDDYLI